MTQYHKTAHVTTPSKIYAQFTHSIPNIKTLKSSKHHQDFVTPIYILYVALLYKSCSKFKDSKP